MVKLLALFFSYFEGPHSNTGLEIGYDEVLPNLLLTPPPKKKSLGQCLKKEAIVISLQILPIHTILCV
jgi:hypothetical protein